MIARVTRMTVYRHFPTRGELFEAVAWHRIGSAQLDRLDAARSLPDVADATHEFLVENCRFFAEVARVLRSMIDVEREEPEIAAVLAATYRGRRLHSLEQLATRIASSGRVRDGWSVRAITDALAVLTNVETFETLTARGVTADEAGDALFAMAGAFLTTSRT